MKEGGWASLTGAVSDGFEFGSLDPGSYVIIAQCEDGRVGHLRAVVERGRELLDQVVPLKPGGFVTVRYTGPAEYAQVEIHQDGVRYDFNSLQSGTADELSAPAGEVTVRMSSYERDAKHGISFDEERVVHISAGSRLRVEFAIED